MFGRVLTPPDILATRRVWALRPGQVTLLVIGLAVGIRLFAPLDADIDWLISVCRAVLSGHRLYVDIVETNPPMAVFIYMPATAIAAWTGLPAGAIVVALTLLLGAVTAWLFADCARRAGQASVWLLPATLAVLLIAPLEAFAQREHIALLLVMPLLGVAVMRLAGQRPPLWLIVLAGLSAGIAPMIKPYFALGIAAAYLALAVRRRDLRRLFSPEVLIAAGLTLAYGVWLNLAMPVYPHSIVPMLVDIYAPMHPPLYGPDIAIKLIMWGLCLAGLYIACGRSLFAPVSLALLAGSCGFVVGFILQARGWPYHALPFLLPSLLATLVCAEKALPGADGRRLIAMLTALVMAIGPFSYFLAFGYAGRGVIPAIRAHVSHPSVMSITYDQRPGHPMTTELGGTWVGTYSSRWITVNASFLEEHAHDQAYIARLEAWQKHDRDVANHDLMKRPDIVLVGIGLFNWQKWIASDPQTLRLFSNYAPLAEDRLSPDQRRRYEGVRVYIRKDLLAARP